MAYKKMFLSGLLLVFTFFFFLVDVSAVEAKFRFNETGDGLIVSPINSADFLTGEALPDNYIASLASCKKFNRDGSCKINSFDTLVAGEGTINIFYETKVLDFSSRSYKRFKVDFDSVKYYYSDFLPVNRVWMEYIETKNVIYQRYYGEDFRIKSTYYKSLNKTTLYINERGSGSSRMDYDGEVSISLLTNNSSFGYLIN